VLRVTDKYFHKDCFLCTKCNKSLAAGGFFSKDGAYFCTYDYQKLYGTKCAACQQYVEGEVVSTMGNTYHQKCFTCTKCKQSFQSGSKVTNTGKEILCERCITSPTKSLVAKEPIVQKQQKTLSKELQSSPTRATAQQTHQETAKRPQNLNDIDPNACAGCGDQLKEGQALIALDRQWHIWCFR
jgi:actin-binding LIM protein